MKVFRHNKEQSFLNQINKLIFQVLYNKHYYLMLININKKCKLLWKMSLIIIPLIRKSIVV